MFKPSSPFLSLLLAAALSAGAAPSAHAVEVKASGVMEILFESAHNIASANRFQDYDDNGSHQKHFSAVQKLKLSLVFVLSESLSARYTAQHLLPTASVRAMRPKLRAAPWAAARPTSSPKKPTWTG